VILIKFLRNYADDEAGLLTSESREEDINDDKSPFVDPSEGRKKMQIVILDKHPINDGRIERHIKYFYSHNYKVFRIHFNRSNISLAPGNFSQFGEGSYRINVTKGYECIKNNSIYFNLFCLTPLILRSAKRVIKSLEIDTSLPTIIHIHDPALLNLAVKLKKSFFANAKIVYDRHEVFESKISFNMIKIPKIARVYETATRNHIDGVISISEEYNKSIHRLFPKAITATVPNFPSTNEYHHEEVIKKLKNFKNGENLNLIYVGSLANNNDRDIDLLLDIATEILHNYPNTRYYIGGQCNDQILCNRLDKLQSEFVDRFTYTGEISRERTVLLTERSHVGFFMIRPETDYWVPCSPNKVFEYLICGTIPVIRADVNYAQDFSKCSLIFKRDDSEGDVITAILELLRDPIRIKKMMEDAVAISEKFKFDSVVNNYINMYNCLLGLQNQGFCNVS